VRLIIGGRVTSAGGTRQRGVVGLYLADCRLQHLAESTVYQRGYVLDRFERGHGPALAATADDIRAFLGRRNNTLGAETKAVEHSHLAGFFKWAVRNGHLEADPMLLVPRAKTQEGIPRPISEHDLARAVDLAPDRIRPWLLLAAFGGLRAQEIAGVRGEDLRFEHGGPILLITDPKGGGEDAQPLPEFVADELVRWPRHGYCFRYLDGRPGPITPHTLSATSNRFLRSIEVLATLHQLRHRYGTEFYKASNYDLRLTQEAMRHRSVKSTQRYTWVDKRRTASVAALLPSLGLARPALRSA
jgi:integrase